MDTVCTIPTNTLGKKNILSKKGITWQNDCYFPSHLREIEKTYTAGGHSLGPNLKLTSYNQSISIDTCLIMSHIVVP